MTIIELVAVYGAPIVAVIGGALLARRNHSVMRRAHERDRATATAVLATQGDPRYSWPPGNAAE